MRGPIGLRGAHTRTGLVVLGLVAGLLVCIYRLDQPEVPELATRLQESFESFQRVLAEETSRTSVYALSRPQQEQLLRRAGIDGSGSLEELPMIYAVTPTYSRPEQVAELTRLSQTLLHVPRLHWIICEDGNASTHQMQHFLQRLKVPHSHLFTPMPDKYRLNKKLVQKPKGVAARNGGIAWVLNHTSSGVLYFMDDDNTYDLRLFGEMRWTRRVSMWPVGLVTALALSTPILRDGRHIGWYDGYMGGRKFPVDMAGFATSVAFLKQAGNVKMPYKAGYEEDGYLRALKIDKKDIEFKANDCTEVYVWHTRTSRGPKASRAVLDKKLDDTNVGKIRGLMFIEPLTEAHKNKSYKDELDRMMVVED